MSHILDEVVLSFRRAFEFSDVALIEEYIMCFFNKNIFKLLYCIKIGKFLIDIEEMLLETYVKYHSLVSLLRDEDHRLSGLEKLSDPAKDTTKKWSVNDHINLSNLVMQSSTRGQFNMAKLYEK